MVTHITDVLLVMHWIRLQRVCRLGRLHISHNKPILLGLRSSAGSCVCSCRRCHVITRCQIRTSTFYHRPTR